MRSKLLFTTLVSGVILSASAANAQQVATGNNFVVSAAVASCTSNADCKIDLRLEAKGEFHVNKEYPYKFKAGPANGVTYLGRDGAGPETFSKSAGDFALDSGNEKVGTMTVKFKSANKGAVTIAGVFKLSVCSAQNCQLETANVSVPVTVR
ncbi:MAG TPA: hypothetical protein VGH87_08135 [Polyangiaceae bacterium]